MPNQSLSLAVAELCLGHATRRASRRLSAMYDDAFRPLGMKGTQFILLNAVKNANDDSLTEIALSLGMDRTTLTRNLKPLQREGWIELGKGKERGGKKVHLTAEGENLWRRGFAIWDRMQLTLEKQLGTEKLHDLREDLLQLSHLNASQESSLDT